MQIINAQQLYHIFFKITILLCISSLPILALITCPKEFLYQIGVNSTCESEDGHTISCDGSHPNPVTKAYIDCTEGFFNNRPHQRILCDTESGEWYPQPLRCFRHCDKSGSPEKIEFMSNKTKYPWYAEILKNPTLNGAGEVFPALIMTGRMIMTWEKYFDMKTDWNLTNFVVRIYDPESFEDYNIERIDYVSSDPIYNYHRSSKYEPFCILILTSEKYITINTEETKPPCLDADIFEDNNWFVEVTRAIPENNLRPHYPGHCFVPQSDGSVEFLCYSSLKSNPLPKCSDNVPVLQKVCQLGYARANSKENGALSMCVRGRWSINEGNNENCEMICGEIDENADEISNENRKEIKRAPWHVTIYSNKTKTILTPYEMICSGSIIHENIIISAAHCFYNKEKHQLEDSSHYLIEAGKRFHNPKISEDSEQYVKIMEIHIPSTYGKPDWNDNVAVVSLSSAFVFNYYVKPICIDWISDFNPINRTLGHIFGWRISTKDDTLNNELIPFDITASNDQCSATDKIISQNFCTMSDNMSTICKGDSGGGFFTQENINTKDRYILRGIISSDINQGEQCSNNSLTIFTNVKYLQEFIKTTISKIRNKLDNNQLSKLIWHRIYAHNVWTTPYWIKKELDLKLSSFNPLSF